MPSGSPATYTTAHAIFSTSISGSGRTLPSARGTRCGIRAVISVAALPMPIAIDLHLSSEQYDRLEQFTAVALGSPHETAGAALPASLGDDALCTRRHPSPRDRGWLVRPIA